MCFITWNWKTHSRSQREIQISQTHQRCAAATATSAQPRGNWLFKDLEGNKMCSKPWILWETSGEMERQPVNSPQSSGKSWRAAIIWLWLPWMYLCTEQQHTNKYQVPPDRRVKRDKKLFQKITPPSLAQIVLLRLKTARPQNKFYYKQQTEMERHIPGFWFLQESHSTKSITKAEFCDDTKVQKIS